MLGTGIVMGLWWFVLFLFAAVYFVYSSYQEDSLMQKEFPDAYPAYKRKTKRLVPFIW
jgi:protein-S-isoprenylcysteine O-methyltransferase Ste14